MGFRISWSLLVELRGLRFEMRAFTVDGQNPA